MADLRLLIHIGLHKTATTWLQRGVFCREALGFCAPWTVASGEAIEDFVLTHPMRFDARAVRARYEPELEASLRSGLVPVLSHEGLSGKPTQGRYHAHPAAERLHATFPDARVLMIVREQQAILLSLYRQYVRQGGVQPLELFLGDPGGDRLGFRPVCRLDHFEYHLLYEHYRSLFGESQVLLLPYELLSRDHLGFVRRIQQFAGLTPSDPVEVSSDRRNVGWGAVTLGWCRRLNRFVSRDPLGRGESVAYRAAQRSCRLLDRITPSALDRSLERRWKHTIAERVRGRFADSNQRTARLSGLDLACLGYEMTPGARG